MITKQCDRCSKAMSVKPSRLKRGAGRFCSLHCATTWRVENNLSSKIQGIRADGIIAAYQSGLSSYAVAKQFDCSHEGVANVLKRHGITRRSRQEAGEGRTFTPEWKAKISLNHHDVSGANNPMFGTSPGHGKVTFVQHLGRVVRSTWEAKIAEILHTLNIRHEYESRRIRFTVATYMPDFWLPDYGLFLEVKGWRNERFQRTIQLLADEHPNTKVIVIGPREYHSIIKNPAFIFSLLPDTDGYHEVA